MPIFPVRCAIAAAWLLAAVSGLAAEAPYTVYAAGDIAWCGWGGAKWSGAEETARVIEFGLAATARAAVLTLGDNVYEGGSADEFTKCYHPSWGRFKARTYPSPGNHEYQSAGAAGYFAYFGKVAGPGYYSVQLGAWHVVSLNSNLGGAEQAAQLAWLRQDLAASQARCTLAFWHHPLYSSGGHGHSPAMQDAWELLYQAGADIVLSGHDHDYERFRPQDAKGQRDDARGIRQFVVGTGGAYLTPFLLPARNSEVRDNSRTGVLKLVLGDTGYSWELMEAASDPGFPNGPRLDRGAGQCH